MLTLPDGGIAPIPSLSAAIMDAIWNRYQAYLSTLPRLVVEWHDAETPARGWLVLNSLAGGAAGGGTRMRAGVTQEEVVYLAKTMELKFAFSGPPIGGGKSGIDFDPRDPRRDGVLRRWFRAMAPHIGAHYGTGGDMNVDEQRDVVPLCAELGLPHPQVGILRGHYGAEGDDAVAGIDRLRDGLALSLVGTGFGVGTLPLRVSDMITGWAVARATRRLVAGGGRIEGMRVLVEGFGNVGGSAALHLARAGARIVSITDAESVLVTGDGLDAEAIEELLARRRRGMIPEHRNRRPSTRRDTAYTTPVDLAVPAAISGSLTRARLEQLQSAGARLVVCGANQPFHEDALGATATQEMADAHFTVIPDVVGSMGMACAFEHLMRGGPHARPLDIFGAVGEAVDATVDAIVAHRGGALPGLLAATLDVALDRTDAYTEA